MSLSHPLLDGLLRSELGDQATFTEVGADDDTVLGLAISAAALFSTSPRRVIWVENGPGTIFSLAQPAPGNAVLSDRAIDYTRRIRDVVMNTSPAPALRIYAERTFFTIAAEEALRQGHTRLAVEALSRSFADGPEDDAQDATAGVRPEGRTGEVATWCYGLLHELGHLEPDWAFSALTDDEAMLHKLDWAFHDWMTEPRVIADARERALSRPGSVIGIERLREEVHADLFATESLIQAVATLVNDAGEPFDWEEFIREQFAAQQAVVVFHRLQRAVHLGGSPAPTPDEVIEAILQPLQIVVRNLSQQEFIAGARLMPAIAEGQTMTREDIDRERQFVHDCIGPLEPQYEIFEEAINATVDYLIDRHRHTNSRALLEQITAAAGRSRDAVDIIEGFLTVADGLQRSTPEIEALRALTTSVTPADVPH